MDKLTEALKSFMSALLACSKLQTEAGRQFPRIASISFLPRNRALAKSAIAAGRSRRTWTYSGKYYRITAVYIEENNLIIHGYSV